MTDTSLEAQILKAAAKSGADDLPDFPDDQSDLPSDYEYVPNDDDDEEIIEDITESDLLKYLDQQRDPLQVVQRLFYHEINTLSAQKHEHDWKLKCIPNRCMEELYGQGWTQMDYLLDLDTLKGANQEAVHMLKEGKFVPAGRVKDVEDDPFRDNNARDDAIIWMDPAANDNPPFFQKVLDFYSGPLHDDLSSMIRLNGKTEYQLAYYHPNNARYERHRDALPTDDPEDTNQRRVTAILYLNANWTNGDGGELKIHGHENADTGLEDSADRYVHPLLGRMVIFMSGVTDHEVCPAKKERFALTAWMR
ncbi:hypothetical protein DM01DRAFT_1324946 [Hesseltinella vesiculosa]|uniref:Fe2OG dioxygenase domain-containing protein n=1 Tax=Hesseltinella vesiculosa TaxID=101127 RepID=A0A1X2GCF8_9FUNG|nr:hypothetical protein DM01DRAFT_1324946 [Hesseltinella vesiculosa]